MKAASFSGGQPDGLKAEFEQRLLQLRQQDDTVQLGRELVDDRLGGRDRRENAAPAEQIDRGQAELDEGRHVAVEREARRVGDRERLDLAGIARQAAERYAGRVDLPAEQVGDGRRLALVRHVHDIDSRRGVELLADEVAAGALAVRAVGELVRLALRERDVLLQRR